MNIYSRRGGPAITGKPVVPMNELENVVVFLEGKLPEPNSGRAPRQPSISSEPAIRQINETFVPHVLPIVAGTIVHFPNRDPFFHNVFSFSGAKSFDLGRYPMNQVRSVKFDRPGVVKIFCHIHSHMNAVILVFEHSYFCVSDGSGSFLMSHVPPGEYTLVAWHERLKPQKKLVTVQAGEAETIHFVL